MFSGRYNHFKGIILCNFKRYKEAVKAFDKAIERHPNNPKTHYYKATCLYELNKYQLSLASLNNSIKCNPLNAENAYFLKSTILYKLNRHEEAIASLDNLIKISPSNFSAHYNKGEIFLNAGKITEALEAFDQALELNPQSAVAISSREKAFILIDHGCEEIFTTGNVDEDYID